MRKFPFLIAVMALLAGPASFAAVHGQDRVRISEIQGAGHISKFDGMRVEGVQGIVTAVTSESFYMQEADAEHDDDIATSEGILVFRGARIRVEIGDLVSVSGTVKEYLPGDVKNNLTVTEITRPDLEYSVISSGNPVPAPVILGVGGRLMMPGPIEDDSFATFDPAASAIDFFESLEGMRVQINDAIVVGALNQYGEVWVLPDLGSLASSRSERGGIVIDAGDFNSERIQLDDDVITKLAMPVVNVGDRYAQPVVGVVSYNFGNYEVLITERELQVISGGLEREVTELVPAASQYTIATYNVENLGGRAQDSDFEARAGQIVTNLGSPDIVVLEEIQDNDGAVNSANVAVDETMGRLMDAIRSQGGPSYRYVQIDPEQNRDGGEPGGNIRVVFLYNPERVAFSNIPGGDATTPVQIQCRGGVPQLSLSPGRIDPANDVFTSSRKPLIGEFNVDGHRVFIIGVHFSSKGGDDSLFGSAQPPVFHSEADRLGQAEAVQAVVEEILACNPDANVVLAGDLNDFHFSAPLAVFGNLRNLMETLAPDQRYSYIYDGNSQVLDQILISRNMFEGWAPVYDVVHVNAEFAEQVSDHDPSVVRLAPPTE